MRANDEGASPTRDDRVEPPRRVYDLPDEVGPPLGRRELFLGEIESSGQVPPGSSVKEAAQAVMCTLAQRLRGRVAVDLENALPEDIGALLRVCPRHLDDSPQLLDREVFLDTVAVHLDISRRQAEGLTRAVFSGLRMFLQSGEESHLRNNLPPEIWDLWQIPAQGRQEQ